jgi:DDE superfamily endonuclease
MFGAVGLDNRQIFREYNRFNQNTFYEFLKQLHYKFPRCYLFLDKASPHYKSEKVRRYFDEHKHSLIPVWLPTASPEFMVLEECWNISKNDLLVLAYYASFTDFRKRVGHYFRTKRFNLNMRNYLVGHMSEDIY